MPESAQLFVTCIVDTFFPEIGFAVIKVLEDAGIRVEFPSQQTCCGQPAFNAGMRELSRPVAQHFIKTFEKTSGPIVTPSGSCAAMVRHGYKELFAGDSGWSQRAESVAERTYEFSEFLVDRLNIIDVGAQYSGDIAYHPSCHLLRDLGIDRQPRALLSEVHGARIVNLPNAEECCGFGGVFSVEHPEVSGEMLDRKMANIAASGAPLICSCDAGCGMHINGGLRRRGSGARLVHISQILANQAAPSGSPDDVLSS